MPFFANADETQSFDLSGYATAPADLHKVTKARHLEIITAEAKANLMELCPVGAVIYTVLRSVSSSGMSRRISLVVGRPDGSMRNLDWMVSRATGNRLSDRGGIVVGGCGMDMGFHLVYGLSSALHSNGYALKHEWL